jgi:hypothetical protein
MTDLIVNPRRVPRAPVGCEARCLLPGGSFWATDTADIGPRGCQLTSPGPQKRGDPLRLVLRSERLVEPLIAEGRIAWATPGSPWRLGVAFEEGYQQGAARWFTLLLAAYPGLESYHLAPDTIELDAPLHQGPIPRVPPELSPEEALAIRSVGAGSTPRALRDLLHEEWPAVEGALFGMIGKKLLTLDASGAGTPAAWTALLDKPKR